jgi:ABC-type nitrate/sulfonate/bicarbonate transport system substrate-binding protein
MAETETRRVRVVPHFMRLHEWVALDEGFYAAEGLEPELRPDVMHQVSTHLRSEYFQRPQDAPFFDRVPVANSACEWGSVCNAGAGMGRFVADLYGVARFAIFARPDSRLRRLTDLRDVPVGVGLMAGSHFTTLRTLESVLPREHIRIENVGGPGHRLLALRAGDVAAATLLDPEIPLAAAEGFVTLATGEFRTLFWVSPEIPGGVLRAYFNALRRADQALRESPDRYLPLWARNVPPSLAGPHDYTRFGLGELLVFEPYPRDVYDETVAFARRWGLAGHMREDAFDALVATPAHTAG